MSTPSSFPGNQTSNFTETDYAVDYVGNGNSSGNGEDECDLCKDESSLIEWPYFNLFGKGYWAIVLSIAIIGTIGNIVQFIMMSDSKLSSLSYSVYLKFLAVSDSLVLNATLLVETETQFCLLSLFTINDALCKILASYGLCTMMLSPWLVMGLTLDRFVCVCYPLTRVRFCTRKKAIVVCSSMTVAAILLITPVLVLLKLENYECISSSDHLDVYVMFIRLIMSSVIPCVAILVLNIVIIIRIKRSNEFRNMFLRQRADHTKDSATRPLVLISVLAFVTILPYSASTVISRVFVLLQTGREVVLLSSRLSPVFNVIFLLNFGQNVFILMGSSQNYRRIMKRKLGCFSEKRTPTRQNPGPAPIVGSTENADGTSISINNMEDISLSVATADTTRSDMTVP
ncbi:probable G-protein coupled receptor 139 [Gigantopelta aegis]|uniref:probable G-protein coupled receptor 139 n=1 Tax=Gigantopelta aegis TaxID=1735272 RepID=UPI001B88E1A3|nr:probable G-protein coupled receptor 139 [Gigantopelta aegis]